MTSLSTNKLVGAATGIEVFQNPFAIQRLYSNLVQSAKLEILLFLPTTSAFLREEKMGIIKSLNDAAMRGVTVKVLTPTEDKIAPKMEAVFHDTHTNVKLRRIRQKSTANASNDPRTKILIIDRKEYMVAELKDDSKETFVDAVRLAIYSATQATVKSYITLFESLWDQADLYDQVQAHNKMQREFINIAAHELRTPIQPIIGLIDILEFGLEKGDKDTKITRDQIDLLIRNARRLERLAKDILEVSRIESNSLKLNKERFDMKEMIRNVIGDLEHIRDGHVHIEIQSNTGEPLFVKADKTRIFEVISNLIRNAIKFTVEGKIIVKAEKKGSNVQVEVMDTGAGIDPEIIPRLFTKFATKSEQGTGLGLFVSRKIIEAHGGKIWGRNNWDEKGATFSFYFAT
jgi:signal transduction histidine kinase